MKYTYNLLIVDNCASSFEAIRSVVPSSKYNDGIKIILMEACKDWARGVQSNYVDLLFINKSFYKSGLCTNLFKSSKSLNGGGGFVVADCSSFLVISSIYFAISFDSKFNGNMSNIILNNASFFRGIIEKGHSSSSSLSVGNKSINNSYSSIVAKSSVMSNVFRRIDQVSGSDSPVLILGESGTGKELVAQAIHDNSPYSKGPFVAINCTAIPNELIESELFGHKKGSFTGAINDKSGYFIEANGGTLFLDEIGDLSFDLQVKLLRVLETKEIRPVGSNRVRKVDLRVVSATHRNLNDYIERGRFREDLYFRLGVFSVSIPPLRERRVDIPLLSEYFLNRLNRKYNSRKHLSKDAMEQLLSYSWRGNVRELKNIIERLSVYSEGDLIDFVPEEMFQFRSNYTSDNSSFRGGEILSLAEGEKNIIYTVLNNSSNISESARVLGISRDTLYRKMKRYNISYLDRNEKKA